VNITSQPTIPYSRAPSAVAGSFDFLKAEERRPAELSYEFFSDTIANRPVLPSRVWFDLDDTLIRPREKTGNIIFQGAIVGAMRAFHDRRVDLGIFSFWCEVSIWDLIEAHSFLNIMVSRDESGIPLIRGASHINDVTQKMASPADHLHAILNEENEIFYYDSIPVLTDKRFRTVKLIERDEMLIDNDPVSIYINLALNFAPTEELWRNLRLVRAIRETLVGYLALDDHKKTPVPKNLSESEMHRAVQILDEMENQEEPALLPMQSG